MLSQDRQSHWVHLIVNRVLEADLVACEQKNSLVRATKKSITSLMQQHEHIRNIVCKKIASLKRNVQENSAEWEVLYTRYYDEELSRSHLGSLK